jgi:hypothetical protein
MFDQAHGEQPAQLDPIARKLGLQVHTSTESINNGERNVKYL